MDISMVRDYFNGQMEIVIMEVSYIIRWKEKENLFGKIKVKNMMEIGVII